MQTSPTRPLDPLSARAADPAHPADSAPAAAAATGGLTEKQRQAAGAAALILCLVLGGGVIWWFFYGSTPTQREVKVDPKEQSARPLEMGGFRAMREPRMISRAGDGSWLVRGSIGQMKVSQKGDGFELADFRYAGGMKLSNEQVTLLTSRWRILHDPAMAKAWGITAQQKTTLEKMKGGGGALDPSKEQRAGLQQSFADFRRAAEGAARADAQKKVLDQIDQIARASFDASRKAYLDRVTEIRQVLTAEQVKKITKR